MNSFLNVQLYFREQEAAAKISHGEKCFLAAICGRVGSNGITWISQAHLAVELDVTERTIRRYASSMQKQGLIIIEPSPTDRRRNRYKLAEILSNYRERKMGCSKRYGERMSYKKLGTGHSRPKDLGNECPVPPSPEISVAQAPCGLDGNEISPKVKDKINTKAKATLSCSSGDEPGVDFQQSVKKQKAPPKTVGEKLQDIIKIYPRMEKMKTVMELWKRKKLDRTHSAIMADIKSRLAGEWKGKDPKFIPMLATYLAQERWDDAPMRRTSKPENKPFSLNTRDMVSHVPFWGPGHPSYDSMYSARVG